MAIIACPQPRAAGDRPGRDATGGNAVDAAVTCAFVQGIVDPQMCGLGGCGAMLGYVLKGAVNDVGYEIRRRATNLPIISIYGSTAKLGSILREIRRGELD